MSKWSLFFLLVPVAGVALFAAAEYLGWSLPPVQSSLGTRVDQLYYVLLAITGVTFIFTQLAIAFLVYFYSQPREGAAAVATGSGMVSMGMWLIVPLAGFALLVMVFPMPSQSRLWMAAALCVGWPLMMSLLVMGRKARQQGSAMYMHGNTTLEVVWTIIPTFVFLGLAIYQMPLWEEFRYPRTKPADVMPVRVIGRQFEWRMVYPGPDGKFDTPDDLHFPNELHAVKGKEVWVDLRAMDVLHSFFLPMHRVKQDAVPGLTIPVWFDCLQSTWEFQADAADYTAEDILDIPRLQASVNEAKTPALAFVKESLKLPADATAAVITKSLNDLLAKPDFHDASRFPDDTLTFELKQLIATKPTEKRLRLLNRKLLDITLADSVRPLGRHFDIVCAELCGWGHYKMKGRMFVHDTPEQLEEWLKEQYALQGAVR